MGSVASWEASVSLVKNRSIKITEPNNTDEIIKFLNEIGFDKFYKSKSKEQVEETDILVGFEAEDYSGWYVDEYYDLGDLPRNAKEFIEGECHYRIDGFNSNFEKYTYIIETPLDELVEVFTYVDLKEVKDNFDAWSIKKPDILQIEESLCNTRDDIYCDNDNSSSTTFVITQKFIDSLSVGDIIVLEGDGNAGC